MTHKDITGRDIQIDDFIVYAALWDRSATLKYGKVVALITGNKGRNQCEVPKIQCVTVDRSFSSPWFVQGMDEWAVESAHGKGKRIRPAIVTLMFLDRLQVLPPEMLPSGVRVLLDDACAMRKT